MTILGKNSDGSLRLYVIGSISMCDPRHNRGVGPGGLGAFLPAAVRNACKVGSTSFPPLPMLSQRTAFFCLRLVYSQSATEREKLRSELLDAIALMEKSHKGLSEGDPSVKLPGNPSKAVKAMYFEPPLNLDRQLRDYIQEVRALAAATDTELTADNPHLRYILNAASTELSALGLWWKSMAGHSSACPNRDRGQSFGLSCRCATAGNPPVRFKVGAISYS